MKSERLTMLAAGTLCALVSLAGIIALSSPGIVLGPVIDRFISPRLFAAMGRSYTSPGAPLWAASFAGLALIAATAVSPKHPAAGLQLTLFSALHPVPRPSR